MELGFGSILFLLLLLVGAGVLIDSHLYPEEKYSVVMNVSTEVEERAAQEGIPVYKMKEIAVGDKQVKVTNILAYVHEINVQADSAGAVGKAADAKTFLAVAK